MMISTNRSHNCSRILLLFLTSSTLLLKSMTNGMATVRLCEVCEESFDDMTCTDFLREWSLHGTCCSLSDSSTGTGCVLTVSGALNPSDQASCTYSARECPSCCTVKEDGSYSCVGETSITMLSNNTEVCPASSYNPDPPTFQLMPFAMTVIKQDGDEETLFENILQEMENYLEREISTEFSISDILVKLGKDFPSPSSRRRNRQLQGESNEDTLYFTATAIDVGDGATANDTNMQVQLAAAQSSALEDICSVKEFLSRVAQVVSIEVDGKDIVDVSSCAADNTTDTVGCGGNEEDDKTEDAGAASDTTSSTFSSSFAVTSLALAALHIIAALTAF